MQGSQVGSKVWREIGIPVNVWVQLSGIWETWGRGAASVSDWLVGSINSV